MLFAEGGGGELAGGEVGVGGIVMWEQLQKRQRLATKHPQAHLYGHMFLTHQGAALATFYLREPKLKNNN